MPLPRDVVMLSAEQFDKLVELLTPGYELAKAYLEQSKPRDEIEPDPYMPKPPPADDASKSEGNPMGDGNTAPEAFRPSSPPPEFDDPSKQGSG